MAAIITATGTWSVPQVVGKYVGGSGVELRNCGSTAFDARTSVQRGINLYDELQQWIGLLADALDVPALVAVNQLQVMLADYRRAVSMGERVYAP
jgi:hypothetical protein